MKKYKQYKPTGISWLPEIPAHWDAMRIRGLFEESIEKTVDDSGTLLSLSQYTGVSLKSEAGKTGMFEAESTTGYKIVHPGQFVMNIMLAWNGSYAVSDLEGIISPAYCVFDFRIPCEKRYFDYLLRTKIYSGAFKTQSRGIIDSRLRLYPNKFYSFKAIVPPIEEQEKIVAYLDKKITLIETCKCQRERELQTLNELKQAEIASVVTRGLNPNVPLKDSGQVQFGEIPAHWDSVKMKYCFTQRSEKGFPNEPVLCATQSKGVIPQSLYENRVVVVNKGFEGLKLVKVGDFVISLRSFQGGIEYAYYQGIISAAYTILTPKDERNSQYFKYLFKSHPFIQLLQTCVTGIREGQNINYAVLGNNFIPIPPIEEQNAIVEYIEAKTNSIDKMIDALKAEIDRLTEYKQRLISDVVTGQLNVQDETA